MASREGRGTRSPSLPVQCSIGGAHPVAALGGQGASRSSGAGPLSIQLLPSRALPRWWASPTTSGFDPVAVPASFAEEAFGEAARRPAAGKGRPLAPWFYPPGLSCNRRSFSLEIPAALGGGTPGSCSLVALFPASMVNAISVSFFPLVKKIICTGKLYILVNKKPQLGGA